VPSLPPPVSALERRLGLAAGTLTGTDLGRAEEAIADAVALALAEVSAVKATAWATDAPAVVVTVVLKAARREFENPQGFVSEGVGEHSATVGTASGAFLTETEKALVRKAAGLVGFTGSVRTPSAYEPEPGETVYVATTIGVDPFPLLSSEDLG
jgi:hypothetical protein